MTTDRPAFWQRHVRLIGTLLLLAVCILLGLIFLVSPHLAGWATDAGHYHLVFVSIRIGLYTMLILNWHRLARMINPNARTDTIQATRRSLITLIVIFEALTSVPTLLTTLRI